MLQGDENVHFARVCDLIGERTVKDVQLELKMLTPLKRPISERKLKALLGPFLTAISTAAETAREGSILGRPFVYVDGEQKLLKVIGRRSSKYSGLLTHVPDTEMPSADDIRTALRKKAKKYSSLREPYIIALCSSKMFASDHMFQEALFSQREGAEGLWALGRNNRVSAVLACYSCKPSAIGDAEVRLFLNPNAKYPIGENLFGCDQVHMLSGRLNRTGGAAFTELLDLPVGWPRP